MIFDFLVQFSSIQFQPDRIAFWNIGHLLCNKTLTHALLNASASLYQEDKEKGSEDKKSNGLESNGVGLLEGRIPKKRSKAVSEGDKDNGDTQTSISNGEDTDPPKKKMRADDDNEDDSKMDEASDADNEIPLNIIRKRSKKVKSSGKDSHDHAKQDKADAVVNNPMDAFMDPVAIEKERESLDKSFSTARDNFIKRGPWSLPREIDDDKYKEVAEMTISNICR